jgi:hypothetical protein
LSAVDKFIKNKFVSNQVEEAELKKWLEKIELPKRYFYAGERK